MKPFLPLLHRLVTGKTAPEQAAVSQREKQRAAFDVRVMPRNGTISIRGGKVYVTDPDQSGMYGTIWVPNNKQVTVTVNGFPVQGQTFLTEQDMIGIECIEEPPTVQVETLVSSDKLAVSMKATCHPGRRYRIEDCGPTTKAVLRCVEERLSESVSKAHLMALLNGAGFRGSIDEAALDNLSHVDGTKDCVVLRGQPAVPARPAFYRPLPLAREYDETRRKMRVATVTMGTPVAIWEARIPGVQGRDVYGDAIQPAQAPDGTPELGTGVILVNDRVVATKNGRLVFTKRIIDVVPELIISHDVSPKDGPIEFNGNLIVQGSVMDGSLVKASGQVTIHGSVCGATIVSEQDVVVAGNIVNSTILAGKSDELYKDLYILLKDAATQLEQFYAEYKVLLARAAQLVDADKKIPLIANMLLETRHVHLASVLHDLSANFAESLQKMDEKYRNLMQYIHTKWAGAQRTNILKQDIDYLQSIIAEYITHIEVNHSTDPAIIRAVNISSSVLRASGNVFIHGSAFSSSLESEDSIVVRGTVRGGFLVARKAARVRELGTIAGVECSIRVTGRNGKVVVVERHPNTLLEVFGRRDRNLLTEYNVQFKGER